MKKGDPGADEATTNEKQTNQIGVAEEAVEKSCDGLSVNLGRGKGRFSDAWLLNSGGIYYMCPRKEWFNTYEPFDGRTILMGNDAACKTVGISSIRMKMFNGWVRTVRDLINISRSEEKISLVGSLRSSGIQVLGHG